MSFQIHKILIGSICVGLGLSPLLSLAANAATTKQFKIIWGIGTQIEPLADSSISDLAQIARLKELVDGYNFGGGSGVSGYWPGRPYGCALNKKMDNDNFQFPSKIRFSGVDYNVSEFSDACQAGYISWVQTTVSDLRKNNPLAAKEFDGKKWDESGDILLLKARERAIDNLGLKAEQARGKLIFTGTIVGKGNFSYDASADKISVGKLATWDQMFIKRAMSADLHFVYQEPNVGASDANQLLVPVSPGSTQIGYLPQNFRMVDMIARAYQSFGYKIPNFSMNIRLWTPEYFGISEGLKNSIYFNAFNFEAGPMALYPESINQKPRIDNHAEGISWILQNTNQKIVMLMPGGLTCNTEKDICEENDTEETRRVIVSRFLTYVRTMNKKIQTLTAGKKSICDDRIHIIPAAYGRPVHTPQLPIRTIDGKLAGTIGGIITGLHVLRSEICPAQ